MKKSWRELDIDNIEEDHRSPESTLENKLNRKVTTQKNLIHLNCTVRFILSNSQALNTTFKNKASH